MHTVVADKQKRVRIPDAKPRQVFSYHPGPDGSITLVPVKEQREEMFPPGSLVKYFTGELGRKRDQEEAKIASGCLKGPP